MDENGDEVSRMGCASPFDFGPLVRGVLEHLIQENGFLIGGVSFDYLLSPIITGSIVILVFGVILNRFLLKKNYPK